MGEHTVYIYIYMALVHRGIIIDPKCIKSKHFLSKKHSINGTGIGRKPGRKLLPCSTQYKTVNLQNT